MRKLLLLAFTLPFFGGCANIYQEPVEPLYLPPSVYAKDAVNFLLQKSIEEGWEVVSQTPTSATVKMHCFNYSKKYNQNPLFCSLKMMEVGNSGWDGPFAYFSVFIFPQPDGGAKLHVQAKWCATNAFGRESCARDYESERDFMRAAKYGS